MKPEGKEYEDYKEVKKVWEKVVITENEVESFTHIIIPEVVSSYIRELEKELLSTRKLLAEKLTQLSEK